MREAEDAVATFLGKGGESYVFEDEGVVIRATPGELVVARGVLFGLLKEGELRVRVMEDGSLEFRYEGEPPADLFADVLREVATALRDADIPAPWVYPYILYEETRGETYRVPALTHEEFSVIVPRAGRCIGRDFHVKVAAGAVSVVLSRDGKAVLDFDGEAFAKTSEIAEITGCSQNVEVAAKLAGVCIYDSSGGGLAFAPIFRAQNGSLFGQRLDRPILLGRDEEIEVDGEKWFLFPRDTPLEVAARAALPGADSELEKIETPAEFGEEVGELVEGRGEEIHSSGLLARAYLDALTARGGVELRAELGTYAAVVGRAGDAYFAAAENASTLPDWGGVWLGASALPEDLLADTSLPSALVAERLIGEDGYVLAAPVLRAEGDAMLALVVDDDGATLDLIEEPPDWLRVGLLTEPTATRLDELRSSAKSGKTFRIDPRPILGAPTLLTASCDNYAVEIFDSLTGKLSAIILTPDSTVSVFGASEEEILEAMVAVAGVSGELAAAVSTALGAAL